MPAADHPHAPVIHLDTNFLIDALVPGSPQEARLVAWLSAGDLLGISAVAWGEFLCEPLSSSAEVLARELLPVAEPLTRSDAEYAAQLFNFTGRRSKSYADCCIAAVAVREKAMVATSNVTDFEPFTAQGLQLA